MLSIVVMVCRFWKGDRLVPRVLIDCTVVSLTRQFSFLEKYRAAAATMVIGILSYLGTNTRCIACKVHVQSFCCRCWWLFVSHGSLQLSPVLVLSKKEDLRKTVPGLQVSQKSHLTPLQTTSCTSFINVIIRCKVYFVLLIFVVHTNHGASNPFMNIINIGGGLRVTPHNPPCVRACHTPYSILGWKDSVNVLTTRYTCTIIHHTQS